jgi:hypothetical protein
MYHTACQTENSTTKPYSSVPAVTEEALPKHSEISLPLFQGDHDSKKCGKINVAGKALYVSETQDNRQ